MSTVANVIHIMIADDDEDDCLFFADVLEELGTPTKLTSFSNGAKLMETLDKSSHNSLPDILFLDLNMPLKNGIDCLIEIRNNKTIRDLPVIIFSTSAQKEAVDRAYEKGANLYFKKPDTFLKLKVAMKKILDINWKHSSSSLSKEDFLIDI